jgi:hypothetical protein
MGNKSYHPKYCSLSKRGTCLVCGKYFYTGRRWGNANKYCSQKCYGIANKGSKNPAWKGGVVPENKKLRLSRDYMIWRVAVFTRDNYTCQVCKRRGGDGKRIVLNADHIKPFSTHPELRLAIDNGRTLCQECHAEVTKNQMKIIWKNQYERRELQ